MAKRKRVFTFIVASALLAAFFLIGWPAYRAWQAGDDSAQTTADEHSQPIVDGAIPVKLSPQARKNLSLVSQPLELTTFWRTLDLPGVIVDRPGISDRGIVTPITGVVTKIHAFPGHSVPPESPLFSIRLVSETLHASQLNLFKATKEIAIARRKYERLAALAQSGTVPQSRILEIENEIERLTVTVEAYRQDLQSRGLSDDHIQAAAEGKFVTEIVVRAPSDAIEITLPSHVADAPVGIPFRYEVQTLNVQLGEQVDAGEVLCYLADHRRLLIEGRGFKDDLPWLQTAAKNGWPVAHEIEDAESGTWSTAPTAAPIEYVANVVDRESRTFAFYLPLQNQWQAYDRNGTPRLLWRYRPGTRVRLRVPVEKLENVFVIPQAGVVREGPETFVFRQNGDLFDRRPVHLLYEDRLFAVVANDGSVRPGFYIAQNAAASLNRVLKAQSTSGMPAGVHVHADGTVHGAH